MGFYDPQNFGGLLHKMSAKKFSTFVSIAFIKLGLLIVQLDGPISTKIEIEKTGCGKVILPKKYEDTFYIIFCTNCLQICRYL